MRWLAFLLLLLLVSVPRVARTESVRYLEVSESAPPGTHVGFINAENPPYLIVPVPGSAVDSDLAIDPATGEIRTRVPLDRETRPIYSLVALPHNVRVVVKVLDENDNAPTFPVKHVDVEFPENSPRDSRRALPPAKDPDLDQFTTQRYEIVSGNAGEAFKLAFLRGRDGVLYLDLQNNIVLDRETKTSYQLVIEAMDGGSPPLRSQLYVNVTVQDVNDNPPIFQKSRYIASVPENTTVGTAILSVNASDADYGDNGRIEYFINRRQSDREEIFRIDQDTGVVYLNKPLDFESAERHELVVVARDRGAQPLEASTFVSVHVSDVNDNQPAITVIFLSDDATPKISESARPGEFVARISTSDPDFRTEYPNTTVSLSGGKGHFDLTTRDNVIYLVLTEKPLDREETQAYELSLEATDAGTPPLQAVSSFRILVTDVNDNAPRFTQDRYETDLLEVSEPWSSVLVVRAEDADDGDNARIKYSIVNTTSFSIDEDTGVITTATQIDCKSDPMPAFGVVARDLGQPSLSSSVTVRVTVYGINDNEPIFDKPLYTASVPEDLPAGRCFVKVKATDSDCGINSLVNYTMISNAIASKKFFINTGTGEICIKELLDRETTAYYEISVIATDRGGLNATSIVQITVDDVNDNHPIFEPNTYNITLKLENSDGPIVRCFAKDADDGFFGQVTYAITSGNGDGIFDIDPKNGVIKFVKARLLIRSYTYLLKVTATDHGGLKSTVDALVYITTSSPSQATCEKSKYTFSIKENVTENTFLGTLRDSRTSSDVGSRFNWGSEESDFYLEAGSGSIRTRLPLDREVRDLYLLNVRIFNGNSIGYCQVEIKIDDINDNPPNFISSDSQVSVVESFPLRTKLYIARAKDLDILPALPLRYSLTQNSNDLFDMNHHTGEIYLVKHLDYETQKRHQLVITAFDGAGISANFSLTIKVQDVNDNPPEFERREYRVEVSETAKVNSQILQVNAVDFDSGNNARMTYQLKGSDLFGIQLHSGWIMLTGQLDREKLDHYSLTVLATDNGSPSNTASVPVSVTVLDDNDNDPQFERNLYEFELLENLPAGAVVGQIRATDLDTGKNALLKYAIVQPNSSFVIDPDSGVITTKEPLDRELKVIHELIFEARDQGVPSRAARVPIKVTVLDVNDNSPIIVDPQDSVVSVREEQPPGTDVTRVKALDYDFGENSSVSYSILQDQESDGYSVFTIDPVNGTIKTKTVLDHEESSMYRLLVKASDAGRPARHSIRALQVEVLALADNQPTFTSSSLTFEVREDAGIGYSVGSLSENGLLGQVVYTLDSSRPYSDTPAFDVDHISGQLVVANLLDREEIDEYNLKIRALDTSSFGNPQITAISVKINIEDANDNPPRWPHDPITLKVSENTSIGTIIYNLTAIDPDYGTNGNVRYSLEDEHPTTSNFAVDSHTGALTILQTLDFEERSDYTLVVKAEDSPLSSERLASTVTVRVVVIDENDNYPVFVSPETTSLLVTPDVHPGAMIVRVIAVDKDSKDNGRVSYSISSNNNEEIYFSIDDVSGVVNLIKPMPHEAELEIVAKDHGVPSHETHIKLNFASAKEQIRESFHLLVPRPTVKISENMPTGSEVARVAESNAFHQGNIVFTIPEGAASNKFKISNTGIVSLLASLDRETTAHFSVPILAQSDKLFESTTLEINVLDENDNDPKFEPGSCYTLAIPENQQTTFVHTIKATDADEDVNGEILYSIKSGNVDSKFKLDSVTGELTAASLDREKVPKYILTVSAKDKGRPNRETVCNITVLVLDVNDNPPVFTNNQYSDVQMSSTRNSDQNDFDDYEPGNFIPEKFSTTISEDVAPDSSIMYVHAGDLDEGINGRVIYSIAKESTWLFRVDNLTGVITTTGVLDREQQDFYTFDVVATDSGKYKAHQTSVTVEIYIRDENDNRPIFSEYPFKARVPINTQPGQNVLRVSAYDLDEGANSDIVYGFANDASRSEFSINPSTGMVSVTSSLAPLNGHIYQLEVIATDKGFPPLNSRSLIEFQIGDYSENGPTLHFQNHTYHVALEENLEVDTKVIQVTAVRSDGRRQQITYSIGSGNDLNIFSIDKELGMIKVVDSSKLDAELWTYSTREDNYSYESDRQEYSKTLGFNGTRTKRSAKRIRKNPGFELTIVAKTIESDPLVAYAKLVVKISDVNDNAPIFTQLQYTATTLEGNAKGDFVVQLFALDADEGLNSKILFHIVDGNPDNAFTINPPYSGIVRTNIVLDREIRDQYRLTIIATDQGNPQLTGTATLSVRVIDVNDNQPTFPEDKTISIPENTRLGTVLTTVTANDVDSSPFLTYRFNDFGYKNMFSIDRFSGRIILASELDAEAYNKYTFQIVASDELHEAVTEMTVKVSDVNDNPPRFEQPIYITTLVEKSDDILDVLTVNATDDDLTEENNKIHYRFLQSKKGFFINPTSGKISVNRTFLSMPLPKLIELPIAAVDSGKPTLTTACSVVVRLNILRENSLDEEYKISIKENATKGTSLMKLSDVGIFDNAVVVGDESAIFEVFRGKLILKKTLDRETRERYIIRFGAKDENSTAGLLVDSYSVSVIISIEDVNDNNPRFIEEFRKVEILEDAPLNYSVTSIRAEDDDLVGSLASKIVYDITSGNDAGHFRIDKSFGTIYVNAPLDCDFSPEIYHLVTVACDSDPTMQLCSLADLQIRLEDVNDNVPRFPVSEYFEFVNENEPVGTTVSVLRAFDRDRGIYGVLNYSISSVATDKFAGIEDGRPFFTVDAKTGTIVSQAVFDYEKRNHYAFMLHASDPDGQSASVKVHIQINSLDEFYPQFSERSYHFSINAHTAPGTTIGYVTATDKDKGPDGHVVYQLKSQHSFFKLNRTTGALTIKKRVDQIHTLSYQPVKLIISASSGKRGSLSNTTMVQVSFPHTHDELGFISPTNTSGDTSVTANNNSTSWAMALLVALLLLIISFGSIFLYFHVKNCRDEKSETKVCGFGGDCNVATSNSYIDPNTFDNLTIRNITMRGNVDNVHMNETSGGGSSCHFSKYDEIPPYGTSSQFGLQINSEISGSDASVSSGHGSAEDDGEDEEIRMINKAQQIADSASDLSVHNTQEYLARLGIIDSQGSSLKQQPEALTFDNLHLFEDEVVTDAEIATMIYGKIGNLSRPTSSVGIPGNPSINGSFTSIVHSEEEVTGSYDWDYLLLDWGPQYQPLAHVFSEIAGLKDDSSNIHLEPQYETLQVEPVRKKSSASLSNTAPPKLINAPTIRGIVPRSPISHDSSIFPSAALSPSFTPSLSPLATRSPNISPLIPTGTSKGHGSPRGLIMGDEELRF